jgi:hypothetical protein
VAGNVRHVGEVQPATAHAMNQRSATQSMYTTLARSMATRTTSHAECSSVKHAADDTIQCVRARNPPEIRRKSGAPTSLATQHAPCSVNTVISLPMLPKRTSSARLASLLSSGVSARDAKPVSPPTRRQRSADSVTYWRLVSAWERYSQHKPV